MSTLPFSKYQGLGNDFILIDNRHDPLPLCSPAQAKQLCDRHFGIGADGVIFVLPGEVGCEFTMRIYNSDGSEPQMCGNGIRCFAKYLRDKSLVTTGRISVSTKAGPIDATLNDDGMIEVAMGQPILTPALIPTLFPGAPQETVGNVVVNASWEVTPLRTFEVTAVSMGNPHAVVFVDDIDEILSTFNELGPLCERHEMFPERVNTEFVQIYSRDHARMVVWERGAGPTMACGTGACAVVVAGVLNGKLNRHCTVTLPGGDLCIDWRESDDIVYMTGPARKVFEGEISITD